MNSSPMFVDLESNSLLNTFHCTLSQHLRSGWEMSRRHNQIMSAIFFFHHGEKIGVGGVLFFLYFPSCNLNCGVDNWQMPDARYHNMVLICVPPTILCSVLNRRAF